MTPFGARLREIRAERKLTLKNMAAGLGVTPAYLSALEHGKKSMPSKRFVHRVCQYLNIIWDEAEDLAALARQSNPRVVVHTAGLSPAAMALANLFADRIATLSPDQIETVMSQITRPDEEKTDHLKEKEK